MFANYVIGFGGAGFILLVFVCAAALDNLWEKRISQWRR
jgi:hypothetical protein